MLFSDASCSRVQLISIDGASGAGLVCLERVHSSSASVVFLSRRTADRSWWNAAPGRNTLSRTYVPEEEFEIVSVARAGGRILPLCTEF